MDALKLFDAYGLHGIVIGALFFALWFILSQHAKERDKWLDQWLSAYKDNTEVLRQLTQSKN